jgi:hypothetical protein
VTSVTIAAAKTATFPSAAVEKCLVEELVEAIKAEESIKGLVLPASAAAIVKASVQVDSLVTVSILCAVEPIVGFELPESVVRTGGYTSVEAAMAHLVPRIEKLWRKKHGVKL